MSGDFYSKMRENDGFLVIYGGLEFFFFRIRMGFFRAFLGIYGEDFNRDSILLGSHGKKHMG